MVSKMTCHLSDARIWQLIQDLARETGWDTPSLLVDTIADREGLNRDRVAQVYRNNTVMQGAG